MAATASQQTKLLVVEPNGEIRKSLCDFFSKKGFAVEEVSAQSDVFDRIKGNAVSCIITETEFPGTTPREYVNRLHLAAPETPIVVLTAKSSVAEAVEMMQHGAHHVIQKPLFLKEVGAVVDEALNLAKRKADTDSLLPYLTSRMLFEVPGTLNQIESVIDNIAQEALSWKIISAKDDAAFRAVLRCALHNAVIHGNKGDEKKKVRVNFLLKEKSCEIAVTDEGKGFVPSMYINAKDLTTANDRIYSGLLRIHCFMDKVSFNARGNQIRMVKITK